MNKALLFTLLLISQLSLMADTVTLQNGLKLEGKITQIYLNKLTLETDFSDPIIIDFKKVKSFQQLKNVRLSSMMKWNLLVNFLT